ncbi:MAG TPA: SusC/RagA family TonB-linked outer membrane protein, partial [Sphingobacteriaceae bacterium]
QYGVDYSTSYVTSYNNSYAVYQPTWNNYNGQDVVSIQPDDRFGKDQKSGVQNIAGSSNRQTIAFSSYLNYLTTVNDSHNILARIVATGFQQTQTQVYHRTGNANLGVMLNYNYKNKYYADLGTALVHSAKLAEGNRTGLSSSATLGWRLSEEGALKNSSAIDNLVISASASVLKTDLDIRDGGQEHYLSEANYTQASGAWWGWRDGASERSTNSLRGANEDLTFINRKEVSANVGISLWDKLVTANATFFVNKMEGLIIQPTTLYPSYFSTFFPSSSFMPYENYNDLQRRGIDFTVNVNKQVGDVGLSLGLSGMYYSTKALRLDENFEDEYRNRTGRPLYGIWGLESAGLFQTQDEIDNSPRQKFGGTIRPGDIKYVDQNNDGVVDERDEVFLGKGGAFGGPFTGGVNLTASWKGFTLFALGTFDMGANRLKNNSYFWVYGNRKYSEVVRDRWTEETRETATYPRLTAESGVNNFRSSDFWMYKANRFNLARVQLSYSLPSSLISDTFLRDVSIYVSGSNLLTLSKEREIL